MHYYLYLTRSMYNSFKVNTHESRIILSGKNKKKKGNCTPVTLQMAVLAFFPFSKPD